MKQKKESFVSVFLFCFFLGSFFASFKPKAALPVAQKQLPTALSIKSAPANLRVGPGRQFPIDWVYNYPGTPFKVLAEFQGWYKVKDLTGSTGWLNKTLLSRKETRIVRQKTPLYVTEDPKSRVQAYLMPHVVVAIRSCAEISCKVTFKRKDMKFTGYVRKADLWP